MNIRFSFDGKNAVMTVEPMQPGEKAMIDAFTNSPGELKIISKGDELSIIKRVPDVMSDTQESTQPQEPGTLKEFSLRR